MKMTVLRQVAHCEALVMGAHTGAHMDAPVRAAQGAGDALGHGGSHHLDGGRLEPRPFGHRNDCPPNARFIPGMPYNLKRQPAHSDFMALPLRIQNGSGSSIRWRRSSEGSGKNARKAGFRDKKAFGSEADRGTARGAEAGAGRIRARQRRSAGREGRPFRAGIRQEERTGRGQGQ